MTRFYRRRRAPILALAGGLFAALLVVLHAAIAPPARELTQEDIDAAVLHTLETKTLPSRAAKAYQVVRPSVVRVRGLGRVKGSDELAETTTGTGVIVVANGMILTNLHVVAGAERLRVVFANGMESDATIVGTRPEHDLAVIWASTLPDDVVPATLRSTQDLAVGDDVIAVGFPFGIGPSVSAGVVSGLRRQYYSERGERLLSNLIQFDAAANPGSSGGPLVTADGEVVGIVTSILNPTEESFFIGIGFAVPIENAAAAVGIPPF
ncbi:MAG TPA: trypsin-like peptidase domain-containing protein [Burkholderiales bacterium]